MLCELPFDLICHVVKFLDTTSILALANTNNNYLRQAILSTPRTLTIRSEKGEEGGEGEFGEVTFLVENLQCISCLHLERADGEVLEKMCRCLCHRLDKLRLPGNIGLEVCDDDTKCLEKFGKMLPGVRSIVLQNMSFSDITVFESMKELEKLVVVCPDMASFMDDTLISICKRLPKLTQVVIIGAMYLTDKIWEIFYFLPNITDFVVRGSAIEGSVGVRDVFGGKGGRGGRLRTLDLSLSLVGDHFLEEVPLPPSLEFLGLEETQVTKKGFEYLQYTPAAKSLQSIGMRGLRLNSPPPSPPPSLPSLPSLPSPSNETASLGEVTFATSSSLASSLASSFASSLKLANFPSLKIWDIVGSGLDHNNISSFFSDSLDVTETSLPTFSVSSSPSLSPSSSSSSSSSCGSSCCSSSVRVLAGDDSIEDSIVWKNFMSYTYL